MGFTSSSPKVSLGDSLNGDLPQLLDCCNRVFLAVNQGPEVVNVTGLFPGQGVALMECPDGSVAFGDDGSHGICGLGAPFKLVPILHWTGR
jgi:hypothetical protein